MAEEKKKPKKVTVKKTIYLPKKKKVDTIMAPAPKALKIPWDMVGLGILILISIGIFLWLGC